MKRFGIAVAMFAELIISIVVTAVAIAYFGRIVYAILAAIMLALLCWIAAGWVVER